MPLAIENGELENAIQAMALFGAAELAPVSGIPDACRDLRLLENTVPIATLALYRNPAKPHRKALRN